MDGVEVSVMACFFNSCQCQPMHPSLVVEGQSRVSGYVERIHFRWHSALVFIDDAKQSPPSRCFSLIGNATCDHCDSMFSTLKCFQRWISGFTDKSDTKLFFGGKSTTLYCLVFHFRFCEILSSHHFQAD